MQAVQETGKKKKRKIRDSYVHIFRDRSPPQHPRSSCYVQQFQTNRIQDIGRTRGGVETAEDDQILLMQNSHNAILQNTLCVCVWLCVYKDKLITLSFDAHMYAPDAS